MQPPPLPPGLPGKLMGYGGGSTTQSLNGDASASPLHHQPRPQSVMTLGSGSKSLILTPGDEESGTNSTSEETSEASREMIHTNNSKTDDNRDQDEEQQPAHHAPAPAISNNSLIMETFQKKHKRIRSIGGDPAAVPVPPPHIPVHTPV